VASDEVTETTAEEDVHWAVATLILFVVAALAAGLVYRIYPGSLPRQKNPSFLTEIFNNGIVLLAARVFVLAAGCYVVASLIQHARRDEWIGEGAGFKVGASREEFEQAMAETDALLQNVTGKWETAEAKLERVEAQLRMANARRKAAEARLAEQDDQE
jgi:glycosyltransferase involved in cell wall biosynthesis